MPSIDRSINLLADQQENSGVAKKYELVCVCHVCVCVCARISCMTNTPFPIVNHKAAFSSKVPKNLESEKKYISVLIVQ